MSEYPNHVAEFLMCSQKLRMLREEEKLLKKKIDDIQPVLSTWLRSQPSLEIKLEFDNKQSSVFGECGKIKFEIEKRKEYLSKRNLFGYLKSFFSQLFPQRSNDYIDEISQAAANHVWQSRKTTKHSASVVRTFSKKRKYEE